LASLQPFGIPAAALVLARIPQCQPLRCMRHKTAGIVFSHFVHIIGMNV